MRNEIGKAIASIFEDRYKQYGPESDNYNPDTCYAAADAVVALLLSKVTGDGYEPIWDGQIIGPAKFVQVRISEGTVIDCEN